MIKNYESLEDIDKMDLHNIQVAFEHACYIGDLTIAKHILCKRKISVEYKEKSPLANMLLIGLQAIYNYTLKKGFTNIIDINNNAGTAFRAACYSGNLELVKFLLTSPELKVHANIHAAEDSALYEACKSHNIELVKFLVESPELKVHIDYDHENFSHALGTKGSIYEKGNKYIDLAIRNNSIDIVEYLLSKEYKDKKEIVLGSFYTACNSNNIGVIKYLLSHLDYKEHIDLDNKEITKNIRTVVCYKNDTVVLDFLLNTIGKDKLFAENKEETLYRVLDEGFTEVAERLITQVGSKKTKEIEELLWKYPDIEKLFNIYELNDKLEKGLENKESANKKRKI